MKPANDWAKMILIALLTGGAVTGGNAVANRSNGSLVKVELQIEALQESVSELRADVRLLMDRVSDCRKAPRIDDRPPGVVSDG